MTLARLAGETLGHGGGAVLSDVTLSLSAGERLVLLGRSGSGKTTLLNVLHQRLVAGGHRVALAPQDYALVPQLSVLRNTLMGRLDDHGAIANLVTLIRPGRACRAETQPLLDRLGLGPLIDRPVQSLSGGQRQRTALARDIREQIQKVFGGKVFKTVITKSVRLEESPAYKESIFTFAPDSIGATDYYSLCEEVIERVEARTA